VNSTRALLVNPASSDTKKGNNVTTDRWKRILEELGCTVRTTNEYPGGDYDILIALHARKSADSVRQFSEEHPEWTQEGADNQMGQALLATEITGALAEGFGLEKEEKVFLGR